MGHNSKSNRKQNCVEEIGKKKEKSNKIDQRVKIVVECGDMKIGDGLGIGNGNLNGGGGGGGCSTGGSGGTGGSTGTGGDCFCNAICEQVQLEQFADPQVVSRIGQEIIWTLRATNVSGKNITQPLVVSSSFFGTRLLSATGLNAGETITLSVSTILSEADLQNNAITSVAFVAYGVPTTPPGRYLPRERVSALVVTKVDVILPNLDVSGNVFINESNVDLELQFLNIGPPQITSFFSNVGGIFKTCDPVLFDPLNLFSLVGGTGDNSLVLNPGASLPPGQPDRVSIRGTNCNNECTSGLCILDYNYSAPGSAVINRQVGLPVSATAG